MIVSYAKNSLERFENKNIFFFTFKNDLHM
jgi:hypothetical protein